MDTLANPTAETDQNVSLPGNAAAIAAPATLPPTPDITLKGRFARYTSPFLQLLLPVLSVRYIPLAIEDINPGDFLRKTPPSKNLDGSLKAGFTPWKKPGLLKGLSFNFAALSMGVLVESIIALYTKRTYDDVRTLYAEAVGYELGKKPEEVGWRDIFFNSKNSALNVTARALTKRTLLRAGAGAAFFVPWHMFRDFKDAKPKYDANANAGVGALAGYLSLDGFYRSQSFFEAEQTLVDLSINHIGANAHEIHPNNILSLLWLQRRHLAPDYHPPDLDSPEGQTQAALASRIADLLNQTYNNKPKTGNANFTIGKFNYLVGFQLLDHFPESLAFVELANQSSDMKEVKEAQSALQRGQSAAETFRAYGIEMQNPVEKPAPSVLPAEAGAKTFAARVHAVRTVPQAARTYQELAAHATEHTPGY